MSQYPGAYDESSFAPTMAETPRTSGIAITALICSLVFCCPFTTILGIVLGAVALVMIGNNPMRRGKGMALTAIVLGVLFTAGQFVTWRWYQQNIVELMMRGPEPALQAGFAGDISGFRASFHSSTGVAASDAEAQAFIEELRNRYGEFQSAQLDETRVSGAPVGQTAWVLPYRLVFDRAQVNAEAEILMADPQTGALSVKPAYLTVLDPRLGDLTYPPSSTAAPPSPSPSPQPSSSSPSSSDSSDDGASPPAEAGTEADATDNGA